MLTFQEIISKLTEFWGKHNCIIHQGHDLEVGAGTFNPATFLRCLGPEPYNTAYVEPSRRPSDGRYGDNPNRMQLFHQFQVILKPSPADVQQLYLDSLEALGLDLKKHDIRFVHDDWESPTIGAWGLGWEVWCDGMEVTQFTYFQAMGSLPLNPISVEITYGLERLALFIQNKESFYDMKWNETLTFKDIAHRSEIEWSQYNFEEASVEMWRRHFEDFEREAKTLMARHLPLPAYDFVMKASHAFNLLEARGAISVTERTGYIARIRSLAQMISAEYTAMREKLGYPLLLKAKPPKASKKITLPPISFHPEKREDFLLEIGSEQLPATFVPMGCRNLEIALKKLLEEERLDYESLETFGTPQRLAILVRGLVQGTKPQTSLRKGPALSSCFDAKGHLTLQGEGFLKALSLKEVTLEKVRSGKVKALSIETIKEVEYLFAAIEKPGQSTLHLLAERLPALILNLDFPKKMRWGSLDVSYARPLHWIVALFGSKKVPFQVGDITADCFSRGHAQRSPGKFKIAKPKEYLAALKKHFVLASIEERKQSILKQLTALEKKLDAQALAMEKVLPQVLHLTEWPQLTVADFDARFLKAPKEVLISEMVEHQKYFPLASRSGTLKNSFIITADNTPNALIRRGNQKVLSARLSDGVFLYEQDLKAPLESFNEKLALMTYQKELGSMLDKVKRIAQIAEGTNRLLGIADQRKLLRAALLCKADLASLLVKEFPELQGVIGKTYAFLQNEEREVAEAIDEHWMPRQEGAPLPQTAVGTVLSLADKLDNLISCYSLGLKPSSSSDPYALRRQSIGLIRILIDQKEPVDLRELLLSACSAFSSLKQKEVLVDEILHFITARAKSVFEDYGFKKDEIEASLQGLCSNPYDQFCKTAALHKFRKSGKAFSQLFEVYRRAKGQLEKPAQVPFNPLLAEEPAEKALVKALTALQKEWKNILQEKCYEEAFQGIATLQAPLAALFDNVKILCDDEKLRNNRIALLQEVMKPFQELLDFDKIQEVK